MKALKNKIPAEQYAEMYDIKIEKKEIPTDKKPQAPSKKDKKEEKKVEEKTKPQEAKKEKEHEKEPEKKPEPEPEKISAEKQKKYEKILEEISGSLKAVLFDKDDKELKKIPVRELTDSLKKSNNIATVVFDGIITQRLLDIANNKNVKEIVGIKLGNVAKMPSSVKVLTKKELES
jgi:hypothetical protein